MTSIRAGAQAVMPLAAAIAMLGIVFGYEARKAGFSTPAAVCMSATTFAGSAQFAAVAIVGGGGMVASAVIAAALLNSRYLLLGMTVAPALRGRGWTRALLAQLVVDETWGVAYAGDGRFDRGRLLGAGIVLFIAHVGSTLIGAVAGSRLTNPDALGLDAAFPALFIVLIAPNIGTRAARTAALGGAAIALMLTPFAPPGVPIVFAATASVLCGSLSSPSAL